MKVAIYILMSLGLSLIFSTMKLMSAPSAGSLEFVHRVVISGLGLFGVGLIMTGGIGILYLIIVQKESE